MGLLIVILNYRTGRLTVDCLRSLADKLGEVPGTRAPPFICAPGTTGPSSFLHAG